VLWLNRGENLQSRFGPGYAIQHKTAQLYFPWYTTRPSAPASTQSRACNPPSPLDDLDPKLLKSWLNKPELALSQIVPSHESWMLRQREKNYEKPPPVERVDAFRHPTPPRHRPRAYTKNRVITQETAISTILRQHIVGTCKAGAKSRSVLNQNFFR